MSPGMLRRRLQAVPGEAATPATLRDDWVRRCAQAIQGFDPWLDAAAAQAHACALWASPIRGVAAPELAAEISFSPWAGALKSFQ